MTIEHALAECRRYLLAGRCAEADLIARQVLTAQPDHFDALFLLGASSFQQGRLNEAIAFLRRSISVRPDYAQAGTLLGNVLYAAGDAAQAAAEYHRVLTHRPDHADAHTNLGNLLKLQGRESEAIEFYRRALALRGDHPDACNNLGVLLAGQGRHQEAANYYNRAIACRPQFAEAYRNLANSQRSLAQHDEARASCLRALALRPDYPEAYESLANLHLECGEIDAAITNDRLAVQLQPDSPSAMSRLLVHLYLHPGYSLEQIAGEHALFEQKHARPLRRTGPHANPPLLGRRLKIGYVSPDFKDHPTSYFSSSLLSHHDSARFEVFCYSSVVKPDAVTAQLRGLASTWRDISTLSDESAAQRVESDGIDILVDLALHATGGRPLLFARKPAPVQVAWLGYPGTTGLSAMDYRLSDPYVDPPAVTDQAYVETSIRLPHTSLCYTPPAADIAAGRIVADGGVVTFGCLNNFCKVNDVVLRLFAGVLSAAGESRLLLAAPAGVPRRRVLQAMRAANIDEHRIEFVDHQPTWRHLMEQYRRIDIALDTYPWNGHTTSIESLWMGVPVVTLCGQTPVSRAGLCYLSNLGLQDLVATTTTQYVQIASCLAADASRRFKLRETLRARLQESPIMDGRSFARSVESEFTQMWRCWCESR